MKNTKPLSGVETRRVHTSTIRISNESLAWGGASYQKKSEKISRAIRAQGARRKAASHA